MSVTEKIPIPKSNSAIAVIVVLAMVVILSGLMTPLYLQNRINSLYLTSNRLTEEISFYESDVLQLRLKINQLSSLEKLSGFAEAAGLGLYGVPVKVMDEGGKRE